MKIGPFLHQIRQLKAGQRVRAVLKAYDGTDYTIEGKFLTAPTDVATLVVMIDNGSVYRNSYRRVVSIERLDAAPDRRAA